MSFLNIAVTNASFQSFGTLACSIDLLKGIYKDVASSLCNSFNSRAGMPSGSNALLGLKFINCACIASAVIIQQETPHCLKDEKLKVCYKYKNLNMGS